ncbi:hypothetical protein Dpep_1067 [Dethiosulfovibrio peptidovorans DSM 11002]|uniref:Lipoprotein n=1 Tax=Dethiosulfovibrio peptidovorans DSM 11002 TaxID=469381 RepID=D2Z6J6_9BACT|nr:hypothetical protein Dpep_1067 [Dethiosulfovibrio peptidovorans DSM 11002]
MNRFTDFKVASATIVMSLVISCRSYPGASVGV